MMAESFYDNKDLTLIVATHPVGYYDICARLIAQPLKRLLSAKSISVKNIPGAGMINGANAIFNAPGDGLTFGTFNAGLLTAQLSGIAEIKFDLNRFNWLANVSVMPRILAIRNGLPHTTLTDMQASQFKLRIPSSGLGGSAYNDGMLLKKILGLNLEIIPHYGGAKTSQAIQKKEVDGRIGSFAAVMKDIKNGWLRPVLQWGTKAKELPDTPYLTDIVSMELKSLASLMNAMAAIGRPFAAPPGISAERLQALREAFRAAVQEDEFVAAAKKAKIHIQYQSGEALEKMVAQALQQQPEILTSLKNIFV